LAARAALSIAILGIPFCRRLVGPLRSAALAADFCQHNRLCLPDGDLGDVGLLPNEANVLSNGLEELRAKSDACSFPNLRSFGHILSIFRQIISRSSLSGGHAGIPLACEPNPKSGLSFLSPVGHHHRCRVGHPGDWPAAGRNSMRSRQRRATTEHFRNRSAKESSPVNGPT
jgi:hypothetical protein